MHTLWLQAGLGIPMNMGTNTTCFDVLSTRALPGLYDQQVVHAHKCLCTSICTPRWVADTPVLMTAWTT